MAAKGIIPFPLCGSLNSSTFRARFKV